MKDKVLKAINDYGMFKDCNNIIVGVSGGADSMALLHVLNNLTVENNIGIIAVHINHCLRGEEADRDENFVRDYCRKNNIELYVHRENIKKRAEELKIGLEECGRNIRYDVFTQLAFKYTAKIATAHTLSDSVETVFMNMIRGASLKGISGIPITRENIIRPLSFVTRKEIEQYCELNNIEYVTDSSNLSRDYTRNKIRLDIIPEFKRISPNFENSVGRMINQIRDDDEYLDMIAEEQFENVKTNYGYSVELITKLHKSIMSRLIFKISVLESKCTPEKKHIDKIISILRDGSGKIDIPGGFLAIVDHGLLYFTPRNKKVKDWEYKLDVTKILTETRKRFIIKLIDIQKYNSMTKFDKSLLYNCLDYDIVGNNSVIRNRRPGDKFTFAKKKVTKSLKKWFNESKIPINIRNDLAVIAKDNEILWVEGFGVSVKSMVKKDTKKVLVIISEDNKDAK